MTSTGPNGTPRVRLATMLGLGADVETPGLKPAVGDADAEADGDGDGDGAAAPTGDELAPVP